MKTLKTLAALTLLTSCVDYEKVQRTRHIADRLVFEEIRNLGGSLPARAGLVLFNRIESKSDSTKVTIYVEATLVSDTDLSKSLPQRNEAATAFAKSILCPNHGYTVFLGHGGQVDFKWFDRFGQVYAEVSVDQSKCEQLKGNLGQHL